MVSMRLSPSKIVLYTLCPKKFWYTYIEKIKEPDSPHTVRGTIFHKVLYEFYDVINVNNLKRIGWENISDVFVKVLHNLMKLEWAKLSSDKRELFGSEEEEWKEETRSFLRFFAVKEAYRIHDFLKKNKKDDKWFEMNFERNFKPKSREEYIGFDDIHGYIDKTVNVFGRGVGIVDYKTSKNALPHTIDNSHLTQLKAYAYLFKRKNNVLPEHVSIYYARTGESVYYKISDKDVKEVEEVIAEIKGLSPEKENFQRHVMKLCEYCYVKELCKPGREEGLSGLND